jgi:hypothetical protein
MAHSNPMLNLKLMAHNSPTVNLKLMAHNSPMLNLKLTAQLNPMEVIKSIILEFAKWIMIAIRNKDRNVCFFIKDCSVWGYCQIGANPNPSYGGSNYNQPQAYGA